MGEFGWEYINANTLISASGPTGSVMYRVGDVAGKGAVSGTADFMFHTASNTLAVTGNVEISGTLTANQYNINVVNQTITNISSSGNTKFGDSSDDIHQFTGSVYVKGAVSSSADLFGTSLRTSGDIDATGSIKNQSFISSSGEIYGTSLRTSGDLGVTGSIKNKSFISSSGEIYGTSIRTSGDLNVSGSIKTPSFISSSGEIFAGGGLRTSGDLAVSGTTDFKGIVKITGSLELTGSGQSLLVLNTQDADNLKEIVFKKAGSAAAAIQINSNEHVFIENENAKDIVFRTNNQNTLRVYGANQRVGINQVGPPSGTLDVNGNTVITGSLTISGSVTLGNTLSNDVIFVSGALTASKGIELQENSFIKSDKNLTFGNAGESIVQYNAAQDALIISGSQPGGIALSGSKLVLDIAGGAVASGSIAGPGSYLGIAPGTNAIVLTSAATPPGGNDKHVQFNKDGIFSGSDNLQFDYDDNQLSLCGTMEVKSGSSPATAPAVFEVDGEDGQIGGAVRGKIAQVWSVNFDLTSPSNAAAGRFIGMTQNSTAGESTQFTNVSSFLSPFSGRVTKIMYRFAGTYDGAAANRPQWQLEVADIEQNGIQANSTTRAIHQATASLAPGQYVVGGIEVYQNAFQVTGSWAWGTGSLVGLKSIIPGGTAHPGLAHLTLLIEFDQLDPYISGSGN
jgi:hypothetical protein